jgi:phosphonate transport system permease protein
VKSKKAVAATGAPARPPIAVRRHRRSGKIVLRRPTFAKGAVNGVLIALILLTIWGFFVLDTRGTDLGKAAVQTARYIGIMFTRPRGVDTHFGVRGGSNWDVFLAALEILLVTLALAFLTTLIGGVVALILGLFAARNLTSTRVSNIIKGIVAVVRAVPTVLWVLIFAIGAGLGAVAAVIGMSFHTVGYLLKAYSESFEELDAGTIEALRASGASWLQVVFQAVLPSSATYLLSWTFIRFEINFAVAVAMGAAAGAGGIGFQLFMAAGYFFDIREIGFITYLIVAVAILMEIVATQLKKRYHIQY